MLLFLMNTMSDNVGWFYDMVTYLMLKSVLWFQVTILRNTFFFPRRINLVSLVCDVDLWFSDRVSALHSVVASSISRGGDHGIHC